MAQVTEVQWEWFEGVRAQIRANETTHRSKAARQRPRKSDAERVAELEQELQRAVAMIPDFVRCPDRYSKII